MTTYYKGTLVTTNSNEIYIGYVYKKNDFWGTLNARIFIKTSNITDNFIFEKMFDTYTGKEKVKGKGKVNNDSCTDEKQMLQTIFNDNQEFNCPIIYEIVTDQNGCIYGKELLSGLLFPIDEYANFNRNVTFQMGHSSGNNFRRKFFLTPTTECHHSNYDHIEFIITNHSVANQNKIDHYRDYYTKSFNHKHKLKKYLNLLSNSYKSNVFSKKPIFDEKSLPTFEPTAESLLMENIEYLLLKLSNYDQASYQKYSTEYHDLLSDRQTLKVMPAELKSLKILENNIKLALSGNKGTASNIIEYLTNLRHEYLTHFLTDTNSETAITIDDLDKLYENFLLIAAYFNLMAQRQIFRNFSLIYLLEVKENLSHLTPSELSNSYFSQNLKSIIITINALNDLEVIEPISIDLFHQLTLENVLHIISQIQFKKFNNEQTTELIKKLSLNS